MRRVLLALLLFVNFTRPALAAEDTDVIALALSLGRPIVLVENPITKLLEPKIWEQQTALTAAPNLRVRTDQNGYLLTSVGAYSGVDGPLTPFGNIRLRTDSNGYLIVTTSAAGGAGTATAFTATNTTGAVFTAGNTTPLSTATPTLITLGGTFANTSTCAKTKLQLFMDTGTGCMGIGADGAGLYYTSAGAAYIHRFFVNDVLSTQITAGQILGVDGTSGAPFYSFTSEPTLGFWRSAAATTTHQGAFITTGNISASTSGSTINVGSTGAFFWGARALMRSPANGIVTVSNFAETIGSEVKVDALPVASACGAGSPAVTAGSTPFAGSVTVGTGGPTTCTITFGGTAFPSAPFCTANVATSTAASTRAIGTLATTTVLTLVPATAWADSTVTTWVCVSSK